jgi:hypothetical protein
MGLVKAELKRLEDKGATCVEVIEGEYKGVIGMSPDYYAHYIYGAFIMPPIQITFLAPNGGGVYWVNRDNVKVISVEEFIEKAGWKE